MKKLVLALCIATLAIGSASFAQDNWWEDSIGIYLSPAALEDDVCLNPAPIGQYHVYVCITHLSQPGITGFEMQLQASGPLLLGNYAYPIFAVNAGTAPTFIVGFGEPLMGNGGPLTIMEFDITVYKTNEPGYMYLKEIFFNSLPEEVPAYLNQNGDLFGLQQISGSGDNPVLKFNTDCVGVATDATSWDSLKSLYR